MRMIVLVLILTSNLFANSDSANILSNISKHWLYSDCSGDIEKQPFSDVLLSLDSLSGFVKKDSTINIDTLICHNFNNVLYIQFFSFQTSTFEKLIKCITANKRKLKSIIIDIRNNNGGILPAIVNSTELFLERGKPILIVKSNNCTQKKWTFNSADGRFAKYSLCIIVDSSTSSGAEAFVSAIRDNNKSSIIGRKTAGIGTIQSIYNFNDSLYFKLTTSQMYSPKGISLSDPIAPDLFHVFTENVKTQQIIEYVIENVLK